ncbi:MAG: D-xylose transport system substrate-binding protein [Actinomycetota bacterium]|nr:D-xylose transport system substrate-binding protein [Actinomycetota bacterium]
MSKKLFGAVAGLAAASLLVAACGSSSSSDSSSAAPAESSAAPAESSAAPAESESAMAAGGKACVILPDAASSARWETADRPFLEEAFTAAGVEYDIQNANGDKAKFATIADGMLASGCSAMLIVNLDSPSAAAVIAKADAAGVPVIDYDRLTLGGGAKYYVSFDNVAVGTTIEDAFADLAVCSALRAQPASGELLRAVLGELADRPGLVERAILRCEHFARGNEDDAVNVYAWEKNCTDFDADDRRTNRIANAAKCRQTARLLRDLVAP